MTRKECHACNYYREAEDAPCFTCTRTEGCIYDEEEYKKYSKTEKSTEFTNSEYSNKLDQIIDILLSGLDAKEIWHLVFNKMTKPAKRQLISELLNTCIGTTYSATGRMFGEEK